MSNNYRNAVLTALLLFSTPFSANSQASPAPLSTDVIRPDIVKYVKWMKRFKACDAYFHETEGLMLRQYVKVFDGVILQDIARQWGKSASDLSDAEFDSNADIKQYQTALGKIIDAQASIDRNIPVTTPASCAALTRNFIPYYRSLKNRLATSDLKSKTM